MSAPENIVSPPIADPVAYLTACRAELMSKLVDHSRYLEMSETRLSGHLAEEAQDQEQRESFAAVRGILTVQLRQIERALERARQGGYGICEDCAAPIAPRRLRVLPDVTLCVECQQRHESRARAH